MNNLNNIPGEIIKTSQLPDDVPSHLIGVILGTSPKTVKYPTTLLAQQVSTLLTDVVKTTGSYSNPSWITALDWAKLTNVPNYLTEITSGQITSALGYTPVTNARTLTINGTTYDLSADRSWTVSAAAATLDAVTTVGNTTTNSITVGGLNVDSGVLYVDSTNNRVGINDITPEYALDVQTTEASKGLVVRRHNFASQFIHIHESDGSGHWITANLDKPFYIENQAPNYPLVFRTASTERMQITSGGNVLINTTTDAGYKLDVNGTLRSTGIARLAGIVVERADTIENVIQITQASGANAAHLYSKGDGFLGWIGFRGTAGTRRFAFESNGNIDSGSHFNLVIYDSAGTNSLTAFTTTRTLFTVPITFRTNTDAYLAVSSGKVLIGTTIDAGYKLDVIGTGRFTSTLTANSFIKNGGTSSEFLKADGSIDNNNYVTDDLSIVYAIALG